MDEELSTADWRPAAQWDRERLTETLFILLARERNGRGAEYGRLAACCPTGRRTTY
jgi:hypothetical protein